MTHASKIAVGAAGVAAAVLGLAPSAGAVADNSGQFSSLDGKGNDILTGKPAPTHLCEVTPDNGNLADFQFVDDGDTCWLALDYRGRPPD